MTKMLASVTGVDEALLALDENVDIIDLKQPAAGALGALDISVVKTIVAALANRCPVSATIGDMPMQAEPILNAVQNMAETGVDYVKIGFFPDSATWPATIEKLAVLAPKNIALIAVLFADQQPDMAIIPMLKQAGFTGVMLDTQAKQQGSLNQVMASDTIQHFVSLAKSHQLLCGLAGSLTLASIPRLLPYQPDYLGFRGALCDQHIRTGQLNCHAIRQIKRVLTEG